MSCCVYLCKAVFNSDKTVTGFQEEIPQCNMDVTEAIKKNPKLNRKTQKKKNITDL